MTDWRTLRATALRIEPPPLRPGSLTAQKLYRLWSGRSPVQVATRQQEQHPTLSTDVIKHLLVRGGFYVIAEARTYPDMRAVIGDTWSACDLRRGTRALFAHMCAEDSHDKTPLLDITRRGDGTLVMFTKVDPDVPTPLVPLDVVLAGAARR